MALIIVCVVTPQQRTKRHYPRQAHVCCFSFSFSVLKVNELLHPHRIQGLRKRINRADRKTVQIYVGREIICFAEGLKQRVEERRRTRRKDRHLPCSSGTQSRSNVFVQTRAHTCLPKQCCCHMPRTKQNSTSKSPSTC